MEIWTLWSSAIPCQQMWIFWEFSTYVWLVIISMWKARKWGRQSCAHTWSRSIGRDQLYLLCIINILALNTLNTIEKNAFFVDPWRGTMTLHGHTIKLIPWSPICKFPLRPAVLWGKAEQYWHLYQPIELQGKLVQPMGAGHTPEPSRPSKLLADCQDVVISDALWSAQPLHRNTKS